MDILGHWEALIDHPLYHGKAYADVSPGTPYEIEISVDSPYMPKVHFLSIEEHENTFDFVVKIDLIPLHIKATITFTGQEFNGIVKIPFIGEVHLENGKRAAVQP